MLYIVTYVILMTRLGWHIECSQDNSKNCKDSKDTKDSKYLEKTHIE